MEFFVNNGRKIELEQAEPDGPVNVTAWGVPHDDYTERTSTPSRLGIL